MVSDQSEGIDKMIKICFKRNIAIGYNQYRSYMIYSILISGH